MRTFNRQLQLKCASHGLPYFDTFGITANATSFDGIHYGLDVNVLKAQLLLNYISEFQGAASDPLLLRRQSPAVGQLLPLPASLPGG